LAIVALKIRLGRGVLGTQKKRRLVPVRSKGGNLKKSVIATSRTSRHAGTQRRRGDKGGNDKRFTYETQPGDTSKSYVRGGGAGSKRELANKKNKKKGRVWK